VSEGVDLSKDAVVPAGAASLPLSPVPAVRQGMFGGAGSGDTSGYGGLIAPIHMPASAERPFGGTARDPKGFDLVADELTAALADGDTSFDAAIEAVIVDRDEMTLMVRREHLTAVVTALRDEPGLRFEFCSGISGVHFPQETGRELHSVMHLRSVTHNRRLRVETTCPETDPHVPSVVEIYPTANWHERETWDFFGIVYDGHPSLTRIEMPDDWHGHPQRKDYPLGGIPVEYKGATIPAPDQRRAYS